MPERVTENQAEAIGRKLYMACRCAQFKEAQKLLNDIDVMNGVERVSCPCPTNFESLALCLYKLSEACMVLQELFEKGRSWLSFPQCSRIQGFVG